MDISTLKIGIIGQGFVGDAIFQKFKSFFEVYTYDLKKDLCNSSFDYISKNCELVFICLPTPMNVDGSCNFSLVEENISKLSKSKNRIIVIKSTVIPGTTEKLNKKYKNGDIIFNPEFLTERNAVNDFNNQNRIILGGPRPSSSILKQVYSRVFPKAHIIKTGSTHAEFIKYFTNCFLATKVIFSNEMYFMCKSLGLDYDKVVEYSTLDERLGKSHWSVPGPDGDFGFGGHCFPKDLSALLNLSESLNSTNLLLKSVKFSNDKLRNNRDWEKMIGRAVIKSKNKN